MERDPGPCAWGCHFEDGLSRHVWDSSFRCRVQGLTSKHRLARSHIPANTDPKPYAGSQRKPDAIFCRSRRALRRSDSKLSRFFGSVGSGCLRFIALDPKPTIGVVFRGLGDCLDLLDELRNNRFESAQSSVYNNNMGQRHLDLDGWVEFEI